MNTPDSTPVPAPSLDPNRFGPEIALLGALLYNPRRLAEPGLNRLTSGHFTTECAQQLFNLLKYDTAFIESANRRPAIMRNHPFFSANIPRPHDLLNHYMSQAGPVEPALKAVLQAFDQRNGLNTPPEPALPAGNALECTSEISVPLAIPGENTSQPISEMSPTTPGKDAFHRVPDITFSETAATDTTIANRFHQTAIRLLQDPQAKLVDLKAAAILSLRFRQASFSAWKFQARQARRVKTSIIPWTCGTLSTQLADLVRTRLFDLTNQTSLNFKECKVLSDLLIKLQAQEQRESEAPLLLAAKPSKAIEQIGPGALARPAVDSTTQSSVSQDENSFSTSTNPRDGAPPPVLRSSSEGGSPATMCESQRAPETSSPFNQPASLHSLNNPSIAELASAA